jgi:hypothetical protein
MSISRRGLLKLTGAGAVTLGVGAVTLGWADPAFAVQSNWRWCSSCAGLAYGGASNNVGCFGNNTSNGHTLNGPLNYMVKTNHDGGAGQSGWRWCHKCNLMNFGNGYDSFMCPTDSQHHDNSQSAIYVVEYTGHSDGARGQDNWRWCQACGGLFYHGSTSRTDGVCAGFVTHNAGGTDYIVRY